MSTLGTNIFNEMGPESLNDPGSQLNTSVESPWDSVVWMDEREGRACKFRGSGVIARKALEALNE